MADVKWIKICTDIFDDEKMILIESIPEADSLIVIWFKLLCMAGKQNNSGVFMLNDKIAYTDEMLATVFRRPLNTVRLALKTFESYGMVEIVDNVYTIPNWEKHQSLDKLEAARAKTRQRVAAHREKQRLIASDNIDMCQYCGEKATGFDHIIPLARGGADINDNKIPCCIECNRIKNDKPLLYFLNMNRERINDDLVANNPKLSRYVTLCNVTDRYIVTPCNAVDKNKKRIDIEEEKKKNNKGKTASRFTPTTVEEVKAYCLERGNNIDAQAFIDFYTASGWKRGNTPIKDWKACVRTWESRDKQRKQTPTQKSGSDLDFLQDMYNEYKAEEEANG